jgi:hypothetical protein
LLAFTLTLRLACNGNLVLLQAWQLEFDWFFVREDRASQLSKFIFLDFLKGNHILNLKFSQEHLSWLAPGR